MRRAMFLVLLGLPPSALGCNDATPMGNDDRPADTTDAGEIRNPVSEQLNRETDLGDLGGGSSVATDINNSNVIVGWSFLPNGAQRAFRWTRATGLVDLGTLPGHDFSRATAVDDNGRVLGLSGLSGSLDQRIVTWSPGGVIAELGVPLPSQSQGDASDFNVSGEVAGWELAPDQRAWFWSPRGGKYDISAEAPPDPRLSGANQINAFGLVVGTSATACETFGQCARPFVWTGEGSYTELTIPDSSGTATGLGVNNSGMVVGWALSAGGDAQRPYKWDAQSGFAWLPGSRGAAIAVNSMNTVVGSQFDNVNPGAHAVAWRPSGELIALSPANHNPHVATSVNDRDIAVGFASNSAGNVTRAMAWPISAGAPITASVSATIAGLVQPVVRTGAAACVTDAASMLTRTSLFSCLARSTAR